MTTVTHPAQTPLAPPVMNVTVPITMTIREARQVQWQDSGGKLAHLKGTLGELWSSKAIYPGNLAYMVDRGETPSLREACRVLLLHWLEAAPATGSAVRRSPQVVAGSTYLVDEREDSLIKAVIYALGAVLMSLLLTYGLIQAAFNLMGKGMPWTLAIVGVLFWMIVMGVPIGFCLYRAMMRHMRRYRDFYQGQAAEEWFVDQLRSQLDSRWTIFRNIQLPGSRSDLDVVLVGPAGVWVFEVKGFRSPLRVANGKWTLQIGNKWKALDSDPLSQAGSNAARLHDFLTRYGVNRYINKAVVLSEPQTAENFTDMRDAIWLRFEVGDKAMGLQSGKSGPLNQEERETVVAELSKVAQANAARK